MELPVRRFKHSYCLRLVTATNHFIDAILELLRRRQILPFRIRILCARFLNRTTIGCICLTRINVDSDPVIEHIRELPGDALEGGAAELEAASATDRTDRRTTLGMLEQRELAEEIPAGIFHHHRTALQRLRTAILQKEHLVTELSLNHNALPVHKLRTFQATRNLGLLLPTQLQQKRHALHE